MHSVTSTIFPVFAFIVTHRVILLTRFCKLLTRVATLSGGVHVLQGPQWHDHASVNSTSWIRKKTLLMLITSWNIDRFSKFFHCYRLNTKFATKWALYFPPYLKTIVFQKSHKFQNIVHYYKLVLYTLCMTNIVTSSVILLAVAA